MSMLKKCPCGVTPKVLGIFDNGQGSKYAEASGDCCSEWSVEFRTQYLDQEGEECMRLAIEAWNKAPRGEMYQELIQQQKTASKNAAHYANECIKLEKQIDKARIMLGNIYHEIEGSNCANKVIDIINDTYEYLKFGEDNE